MTLIFSCHKTPGATLLAFASAGWTAAAAALQKAMAQLRLQPGAQSQVCGDSEALCIYMSHTCIHAVITVLDLHIYSACPSAALVEQIQRGAKQIHP
jgi:hypothetical protein